MNTGFAIGLGALALLAGFIALVAQRSASQRRNGAANGDDGGAGYVPFVFMGDGDSKHHHGGNDSDGHDGGGGDGSDGGGDGGGGGD